MEQEKTNLKLELELCKESLKKAQEEVAIMEGNHSLTAFLVVFPIYPLNRVISLEQMCVVKIINSKHV